MDIKIVNNPPLQITFDVQIPSTNQKYDKKLSNENNK